MLHRFKIFITSILVFSFTLVTISPYIYASESLYVWSNNSQKLNTLETSSNIIGSNSDTITDNSLNLDCGSACLMEQSTGLVIYDYNMHEKLRPASVTKVMSLLLIMEALDSGRISLTDKVPCTEDAAAMRRLSNLA